MKIVFFGVGAVCSVMATLLDELSNKSKQKDINFIFVVRNIKKAQAHFFNLFGLSPVVPEIVIFL